MVLKAKTGSVPHAQTFLKLASVDQAKPLAEAKRVKTTGFAARLIRQFEKKDREKAGQDRMLE